MKKINKLGGPASLVGYKMTINAVYDGPNFTPVKNDIREDLLREQGFICAYCMRRISINCMKIEHWASQSQFGQLQLEYKNMLGCCKGNEGNEYSHQTCDTRKGNLTLLFSPSNPLKNIESIISYSGLGVISSSNKQFNSELNDVLNLNEPRLISNRKSALKGLTDILDTKSSRRTKSEIEKIMAHYIKPDNSGMFKEYVGVFLYYLNKKLSRY